MKWYLGLNEGRRQVFKADATPTRESHGDQFLAVVGPFRTKRGAMFHAAFGKANPHVRCVADSERLSKQA